MYLSTLKYIMAKSKETFNKKEKEKKRLKERQEKKERMEQRKANGAKSFDDMIAYVDDDGNITSTPPDPKKKRVFSVEEIQIGVPKEEEGDGIPEVRQGVVSFFNQAKGFGFIKDGKTGERIFVHANQLNEQIAEDDEVTYEIEMGFKGPSALDVKKLK
jgi:cold shock CspA family protein